MEHILTFLFLWILRLCFLQGDSALDGAVDELVVLLDRRGRDQVEKMVEAARLEPQEVEKRRRSELDHQSALPFYRLLNEDWI